MIKILVSWQPSICNVATTTVDSHYHDVSKHVQSTVQLCLADSPVLFIAWPLSLRPRFGAMSGRSGPPPMKFGNPGERLRKKRWNLDDLPKFEKNFYTEHPEIQRMSQVILYSLTLTYNKWSLSESLNKPLFRWLS